MEGRNWVVTWEYIETAVVTEYARKHEQEAFKFACLQLKRAVPAAIVTWNASDYSWGHE